MHKYIEIRSCIDLPTGKQYNFLFYAKKLPEYLSILRIVLKVVMLYYMHIKQKMDMYNAERGMMNAEKI